MSPALVLLLVLSASAEPDAGPVPGPPGEAAVAPTPAPTKSPRDAYEERIKTSTPEQLKDSRLKIVQALGTYRYKMIKQERVKGTLLPVQEINATVRDDPFAVRLEYVAGPGKGRQLLYNPSVKKGQLRVREAGFLAIAGALWIDLDSGLTKNDSNRSITDTGFGALIRRLWANHLRSQPEGGFPPTYEGWDDKGHYCVNFASPNQGRGYDSATTRICTDPATDLPARVEAFDLQLNLLERYEFLYVHSVKVPDDYFTPAGAGL